MAKGIVRKNTLTRDTLMTLAAAGGLIIVAATSPYFLHEIVREYFKDKTKQKARARAKKLRELERRKLINFEEFKDGKVQVTLTKHGKTVVHLYSVEDLVLKKPPQWDKQWRVLIYDIPISQKKASASFSSKVKQLGLFPLQKSVWVSPYECLSEIEFLASIFNIDLDKHILYFRTVEIPRENELKKFFDI